MDCASRAAKNSPLGCFCAVFCDSAAAVRIHPRGCDLRCRTKQKTSVFFTLVFLVGAGGFEPPKLKAADLQSVPIGHSGTRPYSFVVHPCAGRLAYCSMRTGICQPPFFTFFRQCKRDRQLLPAAAFHVCRRGCCTVCSSPFLPISYFSTAPRFALVTMRA